MLLGFAHTPSFKSLLTESEHELTSPDDATVVAGNGSALNGPPPQKIFRLSLSHATPEEINDFHLYLTIIIHSMLKEFNDVIIIDNHNKEIKPFTNQSRFLTKCKNHFTIDIDDNNSNGIKFVTVTFRVQTHHPLSSFRENETISHILKDHRLVLRNHDWLESDRRVMTMAYVIGVDSCKYKPEHVTAMIHRTLKDQCPNKSKIPRFNIVKRSVSSNYKQQKSERKVMYAIEVRKDDRIKATSFFVKHLNTNGHPSILLPWIQSTQPKAFAIGLKTHTHITQHEQWVMKINDITVQQMFHIAQPILNKLGHNDIVPTWRTHTHGTWNVMVNKQNLHNLRENFQSELQAAFYKHVPLQLQANSFESADDDESALSDLLADHVQSLMECPRPPGMTVEQYLALPDEMLDRPLSEIPLNSSKSTTSPISSRHKTPSVTTESDKDETIRQLQEEIETRKKAHVEIKLNAKTKQLEQENTARSEPPRQTAESPRKPTPKAPPMDADNSATKRSYSDILRTPASSPAKAPKTSPLRSSLSKVARAESTKKSPTRFHSPTRRSSPRMNKTKRKTRNSNKRFKSHE
uniref:Uncharacterized protein n=1 Tax=Grammatophora oceanica TaxID=210454 RepID=A0A6U5I8Q6_9STRA|mmetsp:Transcript_20501/g.30359  ORF Transcript_20501/g.30359 Transcript_20501/m.30359 type:complete len:578 (+) Transcript_20501:150-1883(+)